MKKKMNANVFTVTQWVIALLSPIITFYLLEFYTHNPFKTAKFPAHILNIILFELIMLLFLFLFGKMRIALITETVLIGIIGLVNYFVLQFRSAPIMPWDIFSIKTAVSVANNYKYTLSKNVIFTLAALVLLILLETRCNLSFSSLEAKKTSWKPRIIGFLLSLLLLFGFTKMLHQDASIRYFKLYDKLFTPTTMSRKDGTLVAFLIELEYLFVEKPPGYSKAAANELLAQTSESASPTEVTNTPNIIVIMNEAFSDPSVLGDFSTNEDYMPFLHSLMAEADNTVSGNLHVSVLGGNTANTEFEFLTGSTMAFLPQGSVPYQQYVHHEIPNMASHLKTLGYQTVAMHPYNASGWERDKVYPILGFDQSYFLEHFKDAEYIRKYVSDKSNYDKIIDVYENKKENQPLFLFNVTMQNHSAYTDEFDNFSPTIELEGISSPALTNYLSLLKLSDMAFEDLVTYFEQQEEDTMIVFFGDHQTTNSVIEPILKANGTSSNELTTEEETLRYTVPYVIWSNFEMKNSSDQDAVEQDTSANYLGTKTLKLAGLPLYDYAAFLDNLKNTYPIISSIQVMDNTGNRTTTLEQKDNLLDYQMLQYYLLFEEE